jgi:hypothetical protein
VENSWSTRWDTLEETKLAVKAMIVDQGESWGPFKDSDKRRCNFYCVRKANRNFYVHIGKIRGTQRYGITKRRPHTCPP